MGWLKDRQNKNGLGKTQFKQTERRTAPLRKIIQVIRVGDGWMNLDKVKLECGHQVRSNATYQARCLQCKNEPKKP